LLIRWFQKDKPKNRTKFVRLLIHIMFNENSLVEDRTDDPRKSRLGCFLPDLTRWLRDSSIADLPRLIW